MKQEIENSRLLAHLTQEDLKNKLHDVFTEAYMRSDNFNIDAQKVAFMSIETAKFLKNKHSGLLYGDLAKTVRRGQQGDFNTTHSKEKLSQNNIEFWFQKLADERTAARIVGRDQQHNIDKNKDKESVFTGAANTKNGRAYAFLCKLEADLFGKYYGKEFERKLKRVDELKQNIAFLADKIIEVEQRHTEEQTIKISHSLLAKKRGIDERYVNELAYKDVRKFFDI